MKTTTTPITTKPGTPPPAGMMCTWGCGRKAVRWTRVEHPGSRTLPPVTWDGECGGDKLPNGEPTFCHGELEPQLSVWEL